MLLIATVALHVIGLAWADSAKDRFFFGGQIQETTKFSQCFADARTGWVVGDGGTILTTRDGGTRWEPQKGGTDKYVFGVHLADARTGWVRSHKIVCRALAATIRLRAPGRCKKSVEDLTDGRPDCLDAVYSIGHKETIRDS
jgi:hypothetical protein